MIMHAKLLKHRFNAMKLIIRIWIITMMIISTKMFMLMMMTIKQKMLIIIIKQLLVNIREHRSKWLNQMHLALMIID